MGQLVIDWPRLYATLRAPSSEMVYFLSIADGRILRNRRSDLTSLFLCRQSPSCVIIGPIPSRVQYQWLEAFVALVDDAELRARIGGVIRGKGSFRRFKDALAEAPRYRLQWFEFRERKIKEYAWEWLRAVGVTPVNQPPELEQERKALRDFLLSWAGNRSGDNVLERPSLKGLAEAIGRHFEIRRVS